MSVPAGSKNLGGLALPADVDGNHNGVYDDAEYLLDVTTTTTTGGNVSGTQPQSLVGGLLGAAMSVAGAAAFTVPWAMEDAQESRGKEGAKEEDEEDDAADEAWLQENTTLPPTQAAQTVATTTTGTAKGSSSSGGSSSTEHLWWLWILLILVLICCCCLLPIAGLLGFGFFESTKAKKTSRGTDVNGDRDSEYATDSQYGSFYEERDYTYEGYPLLEQPGAAQYEYYVDPATQGRETYYEEQVLPPLPQLPPLGRMNQVTTTMPPPVMTTLAPVPTASVIEPITMTGMGRNGIATQSFAMNVVPTPSTGMGMISTPSTGMVQTTSMHVARTAVQPPASFAVQPPASFGTYLR